MTRQDLFEEFSELTFAIVPSVEQIDDQVALEDVEDLRIALMRLIDRVALRVAEDNERTPDDAADDALEIEQEGVGLD
jgi:hypothetical protein